LNDEELKDLWRKQKTDAAPPIDARVQLDAMRTRIATLHGVLSARNFGELVAAAMVAIVFIAYLFLFPHPIMRIGSLIIIAGAVLASCRLLGSARRSPRPDAAAPVTVWLKQERERVHREAELLRTILWWYILPFWLGTSVFFWGMVSLPIALRVVCIGLNTLLNVWIYRLNQAARLKQLLPVQDDLDALLQGEAPSTQEGNSPASAASSLRKRKLFTAAGILGLVLVATATFVWNKESAELPRAPRFHDISAFSPEDISRVDAWLEEQMTLAKYPSLSVAIVRDGKIAYSRAFGFENLKAQRKATPETSYHVASVTKAFTAALGVMLHARGVIDLDQPAVKYLPNGVSISARPEMGAKITLRQLASHTSGLPRGVAGPVQSIEGRYALEPNLLYEQLAKVQLEFAPGAAELYSNLGFGLLGHVLERAAGKPFDQLLQELLCEPLQLGKTAIDPEKQTFTVATGYSSGGWRREEKHSYRERFAASGGLVASAEDLAMFLAAQMKHGVFSREMLIQLFTPAKLSNGISSRHTLGWSFEVKDPIGVVFEKNGGRNNCSAWTGFAPLRKTGVAVITNCGGPDVDAIGKWLLERSIPSGLNAAPQKSGAAVPEAAPDSNIRRRQN